MTALSIIPAQTDFEAWLATGRNLSAMHRHLGFMVGDWLNHGREHFPGQIELAIEQAGIDRKFADRAADTAKLFPEHVRSKELHFDHHRAVAKLPRADALPLLSKAELNHWTLRQIRDEVITIRHTQGDIFEDEDRDYYLEREMIRAWNRGTVEARKSFAERVATSHLQTIDEDEAPHD
jgi:hypothetical protein